MSRLKQPIDTLTVISEGKGKTGWLLYRKRRRNPLDTDGFLWPSPVGTLAAGGAPVDLSFLAESIGGSLIFLLKNAEGIAKPEFEELVLQPEEPIVRAVILREFRLHGISVNQLGQKGQFVVHVDETIPCDFEDGHLKLLGCFAYHSTMCFVVAARILYLQNKANQANNESL